MLSIWVCSVLLCDYNQAERGAILPSAVVWSYCAYMTWSALTSQPNDIHMSCNSLETNDATGQLGWQTALGLAVTVVALTNSTRQAASRSDLVQRRDALQFESLV